MTKRMDGGPSKDPRSAVILAIALLSVISMEAIYLENICRGNQELRISNDLLESGNLQTRRHIAELRAAMPKISATFTRLNDGIIRGAGMEGRLLTSRQNPKDNLEYADDKVAKAFRDYGLIVKTLPKGHRDMSVSFEAGSNHLELHRLVPLLAEEENSNAFLFVDKLNLVRPEEIPAFAMNPTGLEARLQIRVLSEAK
jgi:hypothetical protein